MNVFTVIYTTNLPDEIESIPWQLSFTSLRAAKLHVLEEAAVCALHVESVIGHLIIPIHEWLDQPEYTTYEQRYSPSYADSWMIVRTELIDEAAENYLDRNSPLCYNVGFRQQDGQVDLAGETHNESNSPHPSAKSREDGGSS